MPWYKTGTVSVAQNSNAVLGAGTAFIANSRVGDAFRGPDGGWYEVTNIASNTAMSIAPAYQGATNASGTYALAPMQGYVKDSADALRTLVNTYGQKLAALGTTGNYDILPVGKGGTGITDLSAFVQTLLNDADAAAGRTTLAAAKSGANSDITSLSGLTTALSVAQGGTGGASPAAGRAGLGLGSAAIADAVGLVANGAVIESGSNSSGAWIKLLDGTMWCYFSFATGYAITLPFGAIFYASGPSLTFPQAFIAPPKLSLQCQVSGGGGWLGRGQSPTASATGPYIIVSPISRSSETVIVEYIAVGRWKA